MKSIDFYRRVAERSGLSETASARLAQVTLRALGEQLHAAQVRDLADELPSGLMAPLERAEHVRATGLGPLLEKVAGCEVGSLSFAIEHAAVVCQVLADALRPETLRWLRDALSDDVAGLLRRSESYLPVERAPHLHKERRTLAEGEAGASNPLYSARPAELAHSQSVARSANPHGETKLSSARGLTQEREGAALASTQGLTQEREGDSLATARPGARRP